jgi:hypothetical protein
VEESVVTQYLGKYDVDGTTITIEIGQNGLMVNVFGDIHWNLYFTSDKDFFIREYRGNLSFQKDESNKVTGINLNGKLAKKID